MLSFDILEVAISTYLQLYIREITTPIQQLPKAELVICAMEQVLILQVIKQMDYLKKQIVL